MKVSDLEVENNVVLLDRTLYPKNLEMSEDDFKELLTPENNQIVWWGVDHQTRIAFLERNKYEVNDENMYADLSARPELWDDHNTTEVSQDQLLADKARLQAQIDAIDSQLEE